MVMENNSCIIYDGFLSENDNADLLNHALKHEKEFKISGIGPGKAIDQGYRNSSSIHANRLREVESVILTKLDGIYDQIGKVLSLELPSEWTYELHMTSHNHGQFYKPHKDTGSGIRNRMVTFVYYFHSMPKKFTGGQLLFPGNQPRPLVIEPTNNSIIFFDSTLVHAVHPVNCPSLKFEDGRFSVNGWIVSKKPIV